MMIWCSWNANTNDVMPPDSYGGSNEMEPPMTLWCYGLHLAPKQPVWIPVSPCVCMFDCCFCSAIRLDDFTGTHNKEPREVTFASLTCLLCPWCELHIFSVMTEI